jgi:hypothetical protein
MVNNMMQMLADIPPTLMVAWTAWFIAGGMLAFWYRRASLELAYAPAAAPRPAARPKPAPRPSSDVRRQAAPVSSVEAPVEATAPQSYELPPALEPVAPKERTPVVLGDPFGELASLFEQPAPAAQTPAASPAPHRAPGESPILSSTGVPLRRDNEPTLG